jgi:hypothetical protein
LRTFRERVKRMTPDDFGRPEGRGGLELEFAEGGAASRANM